MKLFIFICATHFLMMNLALADRLRPVGSVVEALPNSPFDVSSNVAWQTYRDAFDRGQLAGEVRLANRLNLPPGNVAVAPSGRGFAFFNQSREDAARSGMQVFMQRPPPNQAQADVFLGTLPPVWGDMGDVSFTMKNGSTLTINDRSAPPTNGQWQTLAILDVRRRPTRGKSPPELLHEMALVRAHNGTVYRQTNKVVFYGEPKVIATRVQTQNGDAVSLEIGRTASGAQTLQILPRNSPHQVLDFSITQTSSRAWTVRVVTNEPEPNVRVFEVTGEGSTQRDWTGSQREFTVSQAERPRTSEPLTAYQMEVRSITGRRLEAVPGGAASPAPAAADAPTAVAP